MSPRVLIIGAGMAGMSLAARLPRSLDVTVLEREDTTGYHATGRSAALYAPAYGNRQIRALTIASGPFLHDPPEGFCDHPLLEQQDVLFIGHAGQQPELRKLMADVAEQGLELSRLDLADACRRMPLLRKEYLAEVVLDPTSHAMDVHAILQGFTRMFRANGGKLVTNSEAASITRRGGQWHVATRAGDFTADVIVNAAGAWADDIAEMAGAKPVGLVPMRRSAAMIDVPPGLDSSNWPMVVDADEDFYLKPGVGELLISPADETPSEPCDARPEEIDIAICADRIQKAMTLDIRHIRASWAGLRTFAPDRTPVVGFDPVIEGFFWLAGQGGYGIQTAPALSELASSLLIGKDVPDHISAHGASAEALSPARFTSGETQQ